MTSLWRAVTVFVMLAAVMTLVQAGFAAVQERSPREEERPALSQEASDAETASQQEAA